MFIYLISIKCFIFTQDARPFACHLCPYRCKVRGNLHKHLRGKHKLDVVSKEILYKKLKETGTGYQEIIERRKN